MVCGLDRGLLMNAQIRGHGKSNDLSVSLIRLPYEVNGKEGERVVVQDEEQ